MGFSEKIEKIFDKKLTRKEFLKNCLKLGLGVGAGVYLFDLLAQNEASGLIKEKRGMREALYYEQMGDEGVKCLLCPNQCVLSNGQRSFCRVREAVDGKLYTLVYGLICSAHIDPIEKKPLFHVLPGSKAFSIATAGCNSRCKFCQNWPISQSSPEETTNWELSCENVVASAVSAGAESIAYTYNEPAVFYEYMLDSSKIAKDKGILNVMVTGGKISPEPLRQLCGYIDAANIDLKAFNNKYLREVCAQTLDTILETITIMRHEGVWVEITNLIVPTLNDNMEDIRLMAKWLRQNVGPDVPLHFSRFWPQYKLKSLYPTPADVLERAKKTALEEGLHYVYVGNAPELPSAGDTICPGCGKTMVKRRGYSISEINVVNGNCFFCGRSIAGIWEKT